MSEALTVVFALFPGITQLDFTAPAQALSRMPGARLAAAAAKRGPIETDSGFAILPTHDFVDAPQADILCVPGGQGVAEAITDPATIDFIARQAARARWVTSVCTGAFLTAGGVTSGLDFALPLIARLRGDAAAQAIQLAIEYDPAPPFPGGHPDSAPAAVTGGLKARIYDAAAARMESALRS